MVKWKKYIFKDIAKFIDYRGKTPKKTDTGVPLITAKNVRMGYVSEEPKEFIANEDFEGWMTRGIPNVGDILFTTEAPLGNVAELTLPYRIALAQRLVTFQPLKDDYISKFLKYYMLSPIFQRELWTEATGTTVKGIKTSILKKFEIPLPPLPEQKRIVAKLDALFEKIDRAIGLLEENIAHTEALMGSVLDEEFGKLDCELIPIKELVVKTKTVNPKKEYLKKRFTYIDISSINNDTFEIENPKELLGEEAPSRARKVVENGDIIFATTRPNLKNIAIVEKEFENPISSTGFCLLRTKKKLINNEYLFYFLISEKVQDFIQPFIRGAQYPAISDKNLLSVKIPLPTVHDQVTIVNLIKSMFNKSNKLKVTQTEKLNHLKALKNSLLDQAFKGEL